MNYPFYYGTYIVLNHRNSSPFQQPKTLHSKKMIIIVPSFFRLTSSHITYSTALCTVHKMIRKTNAITV